MDDTEDSEEEQNENSKNSSNSRSFSKNRQLYAGEVAYIPNSNNLSEERGQKQKSTSVIMENIGKIALFVVVLCLIFLAVTSNNFVPEKEFIRLEDIQKEFPLQDQDFWLAVDSGLKEVVKFNKPSVFLFLYKQNGESTTERILTNISAYASCFLNNCEQKPIILSSKKLSANEALKKDTGYLLTTYKTDLEAKHVLVLKNLENLPGYAARSLHSFCDEFSPAVRKSVFFFTVKVPELPQMELNYVKALLKEKWHDIEDDHFEPLFARISGMILSVKS